MEKPRNDSDIRVLANPPAGARQVVEAGSGRTAIRLELRNQGRDLLLLVTGGEAHVGAVAVSHGQGAELMVVPGHKEGLLAAECAEAVAGAFGCTCAVVVGIHQDDATGEEVRAIVANVQAALKALVQGSFAAENHQGDGHEQP